MVTVGRFIGRYLGQKAQSMLEYALVIAFVVALGAYFLSGTGPLGGAVNESFNSAQEQLKSEQGGE